MKKLFQNKQYPGGAFLNEKDPRDIIASSFQKQKTPPKKHLTDISMLRVLDQGANGSCVGHAVAQAIAYYDHKETGSHQNPSPRYIYGLAKRMDGLASEGTYPRIAGNIITNLGCATENTVPNVNSLPHQQYISFVETEAVKKDALPRKVGGYAFANPNIDELKNAIINNGVVCVSLHMGNWNRQPVKPGNGGRHYILVYGYDKDRFFFLNSWGESWGNKGHGSFDWKDHKDTIADIMVITDIPNKAIEKAKSVWKYKYFRPSEKTGVFGTVADLKLELLEKLDRAREIAGIPFVITSGFRTPEHNLKVGGKPNSSHLRGLAVDLAVTPQTYMKVLTALEKAGFNRFGLGKTFIHADCDTSLPQNTVWFY